ASYFFYNRAVSFPPHLPKPSPNLRAFLPPPPHHPTAPQNPPQHALPAQHDADNRQRGPATTQHPPPATAQTPHAPGLITESIGTVTEVVLTLLFIPFLVYFMLSWQEHTRTKSVLLFRPENRTTAYVTIGKISAMLRSFIAGNFVIGLFMSVCSLV